MTKYKLHLNKNEVENLYYHFPGSVSETIDMPRFISLCSTDNTGRPPVWFPGGFMSGQKESPHDAHIALSGTAHMDFDEQWKPVPAHWGKPPNCQMKGHAGVMRALPGGYGKGNEPMEKWVKQNMEHDRITMTTERGVKPFPLGNYSLGSAEPGQADDGQDDGYEPGDMADTRLMSFEEKFKN